MPSGGGAGEWGVAGPRRNFWRIVPIGILLVLAACLLALVGLRSVRSYQEMRNEQRLRAGEAIGVRPWMTLPYIARVYNIPEADVFATLGLDQSDAHRRAPLQAIARREGRDLDADTLALNRLIEARRRERGTPVAPASPRSSP